jgi:hypothetical protein
MRVPKSLGVAVLAAWVVSTGCTTLRELPRTDYASTPQRKGVHVETREGLVYDFDSATFDPDSLTGYRTRSDLEGSVDEVAVVHVALDDVTRMRTRTVDWYRTGLVGGGVLAGVVAVGLARAGRGGGDGGGSGGCRPCSPAARAGP